MDEYSEQELLDMQGRINRLLANAERARTWMRPMTDTDVYPADWRWRATRRAEIREKQREHAEAEATRLGRSLKCGVDHRHADQVGGCLNASWPWRIRVGRLTHRVAVALIDAAERRTRTVVKITADRKVLGELHRRGLLDEDWDDTPADVPTPVREVSE